MQVTIRNYEAVDLHTVISIWLDGWKSTSVPNCPVTAMRLLERIPNAVARGACSIYVATSSGKVIAFIVFVSDKVDQLFVAPDFQNRGVGKHLLDFAKTQNPEGFWLTAIAASPRACRFYEREGLKAGETTVDSVSGHRIVRYDWLP